MTEIDAYQEYIRCKHNAFCKAVIRYAAIGKIIRLRQKWEQPDSAKLKRPHCTKQRKSGIIEAKKTLCKQHPEGEIKNASSDMRTFLSKKSTI